MYIMKKTILDEFEKNTPLSIIWLSCLEQPRSLPEIIRLWNYKSHTIFYKKDFPSYLLDHRFVKKIRTTYFSILDGWFDNLESSLDFVKLIKKDKDTWKLILESEDVRSTFFKSTALFKLLEEDSSIAKKYWSQIPIMVIKMMCSFDIFGDFIKKVKLEKQTEQFKLLLLSFFGSVFKLFHLNFPEYINEIGLDKMVEVTDKFSETIRKTQVYKEVKKELKPWRSPLEAVITLTSNR